MLKNGIKLISRQSSKLNPLNRLLCRSFITLSRYNNFRSLNNNSFPIKLSLSFIQNQNMCSRDNGGSNDQSQNNNREIFVANLPWRVDKNALGDFFSKFGDVEDAKVVIDPEGRSKGFGFVKFFSAEDCERALAEADNLNMAGRPITCRQKTSDLSQATIYVSLEPCSHYGKTPPCVDLIIQHKFKKVVIASLDPNPKVASVTKLMEHGIEVEVVDDVSATLLNDRFFTNHLKNRPHYILKLASTIDGKIADYAKNSQWISNAASRQFVHDHLRANVDAIMTSYKTVIQDQASLTIRKTGGAIQETNVLVIDKNLDLLEKQYESLPIFYPRTNTKIIFITANPPSIQLPENIECIIGTFNEQGLVFSSIAANLLELGYYKILTEAGTQLNSSMIQQNTALRHGQRRPTAWRCGGEELPEGSSWGSNRNLVFDLSIAHDRFGSSSHV